MKQKLVKPKKSRRIFNNTLDISLFEEELFFDGLSHTEKLKFMALGTTTLPNHQATSDVSKLFYWPATDSFVSPDESGIDELLLKNEVIPFSQYYLSLLEKKISQDNELSINSSPIIFESKGKTPPSVPYLRVMIEAELGDEDMLYSLHQKTF